MNFSSSLAREAKISDRTECLSLNDEPFMIRRTLISLNPVELKCHPFMINVMEVVMSYLQKKVFRKKQKI